MKQYETPCMIVIAVANVIATSGGMTAGSGTGTSCDLLPGARTQLTAATTGGLSNRSCAPVLALGA